MVASAEHALDVLGSVLERGRSDDPVRVILSLAIPKWRLCLDQEVSSQSQSFQQIVEVILCHVDVVFCSVLEALTENLGETEDLSLTNSDRIKNRLVSLVHFGTAMFVRSPHKLLLEVCGKPVERSRS